LTGIRLRRKKMLTKRVTLFVLALALLATFATPASAQAPKSGRPITLSVETHTEDGYAVKVYVDPFAKLKEQHPDKFTFSDVVVVDNGRAQVIRDPIFVVGF
jgi:ABC-type glycerol-3-phosphate transport system substrate-binding protein